jgi:plasmid maintenance system killer protein
LCIFTTTAFTTQGLQFEQMFAIMLLTFWVNNIVQTLDIIFRTKKLQKECNDFRMLQRTHGARRAILIRRRLDELRAANSLAEITQLPGPRMHQLKGDRQGQISLDLDHPYRLLLVVANNPIPQRDNGNINLAKVTAVMIFSIEDTHD